MSAVASSFKEVDTAIQLWRQGDCVVSVEEDFVFRYLPSLPVSDVAKDQDTGDSIFAASREKGLVVITQTCDLVRDVSSRPFVEVCLLVEVTDDVFNSIRSKMRPRFVEVPALREQRLVGDLDRVMTVEKPVLITWSRIQGCRTDAERRAFAEALARKRSRPALPDDFLELIKQFGTRLKDKHNKATPEGIAIRQLEEIRLQASPNWDDDKVKVRFWFLHDLPTGLADEDDYKNLCKHIEDWMKKIKTTGTRFEIDHLSARYSDLSALEYIGSDRMDFDYLSNGEDS